MNLTNLTNSTALGVHNNFALGGTLIVIDILIITFNVLTIMVIMRFQTKNAVDVFVLTLALHDLVKGLVPVPITIYVYFSNFHLEEKSVLCNLYGWVAFMTNAGSMLILTLMAIERFGAIIKPFSYRAWVSPGKIQMVAFIAVVFTAFHSALPLMGVGRIKPYYNGAYAHFDYSIDTSGTRHYSIFILCLGFVMIATVIVAYSFVFYKIRSLITRHRRMNRVSEISNSNSGGRELNLKTETMFSYLALVLMLMFLFSWLPFLLVVAATQLGMGLPLENLDLYTMRIVVVNSMLNPLAYVALCKPYRTGILYYFRKMFSACGVIKRPNNDIWDPWKRGTLARKPKTEKYTSNSCTDSGIAGFNEYSKQRIPSTFQSYDTYRAKKHDKYMESSLLEPENEPNVNENGAEIRSLRVTPFEDSTTKLLLEDEFGFVQDDELFGAGIRRCDTDDLCGSSDVNSADETTISIDTITKLSSHSPTTDETSHHNNEDIAKTNKTTTSDVRAEDISVHYSHSIESKHSQSDSVEIFDKNSAVENNGLNKDGKDQQRQQQQQQQQHTKRELTPPLNKNVTKNEIKMKRRRSKSMTNLLLEEWTPYRLFAKKSASSLDFFFQHSLQCNGIPHDDLFNNGITSSPYDSDCTSDNVRINDRNSIDTPLKNLAKMIRECDSNEINVSHRTPDRCVETCCKQYEGTCDSSSSSNEGTEKNMMCEHCCYKQLRSGEGWRDSVLMRTRTQSLQHLNTCTCARKRNQDIGRSMECALNVHSSTTSDHIIPDLDLLPKPGSRKSRDFLLIDKLLEKTVLSLYENQPYDT